MENYTEIQRDLFKILFSGCTFCGDINLGINKKKALQAFAEWGYYQGGAIT
jgi:hypothetical protein